MTKITIDAGHGGTDSGAGKNGLVEKVWVLEIAKKVEAHLKSAGHAVHMTRTTDKFVGLSQRALSANGNGSSIFVSIHFNAGGGQGYEDYRFLNSTDDKTVKLQNAIHSKVSATTSKYGLKNRGKKTDNFAVLRETSMPAILLEAGFCDSSDHKTLSRSDFKDAYALSIADGIQAYLGKKLVSNSATKPPVSNATTKTHTVVKGDTISDIAKKYKTTTDKIKALNPSIKDINKIAIGDKIKVNGTASTTHTVVKGDTVSDIAKKYGTTSEKIKKLNPKIKDINKIAIGEKIIVK